MPTKELRRLLIHVLLSFAALVGVIALPFCMGAACSNYIDRYKVENRCITGNLVTDGNYYLLCQENYIDPDSNRIFLAKCWEYKRKKKKWSKVSDLDLRYTKNVIIDEMIFCEPEEEPEEEEY